jgi:hypothetical protein
MGISMASPIIVMEIKRRRTAMTVWLFSISQTSVDIMTSSPRSPQIK